MKLIVQSAFSISAFAFVATLIKSIPAMNSIEVNKWWTLFLLTLISITTPIWATVLSFFTEGVLAILIAIMGVIAFGPVIALIRNPLHFFQKLTKILMESSLNEDVETVKALGFLFFVCTTFALALPLFDCIRCRRITLFYKIDGMRFLWGCCYVAVAVFVCISLSSLELLSLFGVCLLHKLQQDSDSHTVTYSQVYLHMLALLPFCLLVRIAITSYCSMLEAVSLYPRATYYRRIANRLSKKKNQYLQKQSEYNKRTFLEKDSWTGILGQQRSLRSSMRDTCTMCIEMTERAEFRLRHKSATLEACVEDRRKGLAELEDVSICFDKETDRTLVNQMLALKIAPSGVRKAATFESVSLASSQSIGA